MLLRLYWRENDDDVPIVVLVAIDRREKGGNSFKHRRSHFSLSVGLTPAARGQKLAGISTILLKRCQQFYPPRAHDIYEAPATRKIWEDYRASTPYPDPRGGRTWKPLLELDPNRLQHVVKENQSTIIKDISSHEIIGIVIRNFSNNNKKLLSWINEVIAENTGSRRSVRVGSIPCLALINYLMVFQLEDPGKLCQIGYTSGARSSPQLGWARNLLRKKDDATVTRLMYECSSVFALFWNLIRNQLPKEVNKDFEGWLRDSQMVRMDTKGAQDTAQGEYTVKYGADEFTFHGVDMPPPSGLIATNYSRCVHYGWGYSSF